MRGHDPARRYTFVSWKAMMSRCHNPKHKTYSKYGGRGIVVCERWRTFSDFWEDMGNRPQGMTIDRLDGTDIYRPGNCRWATWSQQMKNRTMPKRT